MINCHRRHSRCREDDDAKETITRKRWLRKHQCVWYSTTSVFIDTPISGRALTSIVWRLIKRSCLNLCKVPKNTQSRNNITVNPQAWFFYYSTGRFMTARLHSQTHLMRDKSGAYYLTFDESLRIYLNSVAKRGIWIYLILSRFRLI